MQLGGDLTQQFADDMGQILGPDFPSSIAVAVSGGGDSMAMLHLAAAWARVFGVTLRVVTVDHGLRDASASEAALVKDEAAGLGLAHDTLAWTGWDGQGNLQDAARSARLDLIGAWLRDCRHVLMAHTQDDQAETLLMRLARGSGVDGLSAMAPTRYVPQAGGFHVVRPLLGVRRDALRHYLTTLHIPFVDDPSNDDPRFGRVRMRALIGAEGLDVDTLARTATQMARAREALTRRATEAAAALARPDPIAGFYMAYDSDGFAKLDAETRLRILAAAVMSVGKTTYKPRLSALESTMDVALSGGTATLNGCIVAAHRADVLICREAAATMGPVPVNSIWDARWRVTGPAAEVRALGEAGVQALTDWRSCGMPRLALLASPGIWQGDTLLAAPLAAPHSTWDAQIVAYDDAMTLAH